MTSLKVGLESPLESMLVSICERYAVQPCGDDDDDDEDTRDGRNGCDSNEIGSIVVGPASDVNNSSGNILSFSVSMDSTKTG